MSLRTSLVAQPHLYIGDTLGRPLDGGRVYFGEVDKDPELYPINVFYDEALTIAAPQPIRTKGGFMYANGDMAEIYAVETRYSVRVLDAYGRQVFYKPDMQSVNDVSNELDSVDDISSMTGALNGNMIFVKGSQGGTFVYDSAKSAINDGGLIINGWVRQLQTPYITPEMFGCKGDGIADDTIALNKFAAVNYRYKKAAKTYLVSSDIFFNISIDNCDIDFGKSTIVGTPAIYSVLDIQVTAKIKTLTITTGSYDGGDIVNTYMNARSIGIGDCDNVTVNCEGVLRNFSNINNTRSTTGIRLDIKCDIVTVNDLKSYDINNVNGIDGSSSSSGAIISGYRKFGIANNPIVEGVYTTTGVDADGLVFFEQTGVASTGTGLAIVNNPNLKQTCGRGIKSQSSLKIRNMTLDLEPPSKGVILQTSWRGIDAQNGNIDVDGVHYNLAESCFPAVSDATLIAVKGSADGKGTQKIKNIFVSGESFIQYAVMLSDKNSKAVYIDGITAIDAQSKLNILYPVSNRVTDTISIKNIVGTYKTSSYLIFDNYLVGRCNSLNIDNISEGFVGIDISKFDNINVDAANFRLNGTIDYDKISKNSNFYFGSGAGITYTTLQDVPIWASTYCTYAKGRVLDTRTGKILTKSDSVYYETILPTPVKVANKP